MIKTLLLLFIFFFTVLPLSAQEKIAVSSEASEGKVNIYYELQGNPAKEYEIDLRLKRISQPAFSYIPENLDGDVNEGKYATAGKKTIIWKLTEEEKNMFSEGEDFYFEVTAKPAQKGPSWYYYVGAALVAGGAAAAIITWNSQGDSGGQTNQSLPVPPGRP